MKGADQGEILNLSKEVTPFHQFLRRSISRGYYYVELLHCERIGSTAAEVGFADIAVEGVNKMK